MVGRKMGFEGAGHCRSGISAETLRLAVILVLRLSGYAKVEFDRVINVRGRRLLIPVYAEDGGGNRIAVWCITKASSHELKTLYKVSKLLMRVGCPVAIAIPTGLAENLNQLLRVTSNILMLDKEGCLWVYSGLRLPANMFGRSEDTSASRICGEYSDRDLYYIA